MANVSLAMGKAGQYLTEHNGQGLLTPWFLWLQNCSPQGYSGIMLGALQGW